MTSSAVIEVLIELSCYRCKIELFTFFYLFAVARHGLPRVVMSDNGTRFTSADSRAFVASSGIKHNLTALHYHSLPHTTNGVSPAKLFYGRDIRMLLNAWKDQQSSVYIKPLER